MLERHRNFGINVKQTKTYFLKITLRFLNAIGQAQRTILPKAPRRLAHICYISIC